VPQSINNNYTTLLAVFAKQNAKQRQNGDKTGDGFLFYLI